MQDRIGKQGVELSYDVYVPRNENLHGVLSVASGTWNRFDDKKVCEQKESAVRTQYAYMLFYEEKRLKSSTIWKVILKNL